MNSFNFETIEQYKQFLQKKLQSLGKNAGYDYYAHYIDCLGQDKLGLYGDKPFAQIVKEKAVSIMQTGLRLDRGFDAFIRYTSINGTAKYLFGNENLQPQKIIDYRYNSRPNEPIVVIILAIPKKIYYKGKMINFSSFEGVHELNTPEFTHSRFSDVYTGNLNLRHIKFSLFDCTNDSVIPKEFVLGAQLIDEKTGEIKFVENQWHVSNMNEAQKNQFIQKYDRIIEKLGVNDDASNVFEVITKKSLLENKYYSDLECEDI